MVAQRFVKFNDVIKRLNGRRIAVVGSGPSVLQNKRGEIDAYDIVVRVNNYSIGEHQGKRADVHFSFYGGSIKKKARDLLRDGVKLCMCKCPNSQPIVCDWHIKNNCMGGVDFTNIYRRRADFWFCDTYIPDTDSFVEKFKLLDEHIPTTGFTAILDILNCYPQELYITGFDFFTSGIHNTVSKWKPGNPEDPIKHMPELEIAWLKKNINNYPIHPDRTLRHLLLA